MEQHKIDIVIADDHKLFRKGMRALLSDFDFVGQVYEAENGIELLKMLETSEKKSGIILLDLQMPGMDGLEANRQIRELYPKQKVIVLTMEDDEQIALYMISEGVDGYLMKNADPDELEKAIKQVMKNDFYFSGDLTKQLVLKRAKKENRGREENTPVFTSRELEILELICQEQTTAEIAEELNLSERTIEGYRRKLLEKSGVKNIAGLVVFALKNSLVQV